jgi:UDP-N-acetylmuramoyl-tripeptide--D-alanyl-D-alanine ligase
MATLVFTVVIMALYIVGYCTAKRWFTHMLQLSSYQFEGYFRFLGTQLRWLPLIFVCAPMACILLDFRITGDIAAIIFFGVIIFLYWPKRGKVKKAFAVTDRVKRLFITEALLWAVIAAVLWAVHSLKVTVVVLSVLFAALPLITALVNLINVPVESAVRNWYINDAKRILAGRPDLRIIGITGSFGKTSVKYYLTTLLEEGYRVLKTPESYNTPMGVVKTIRGSLEPTHQIFVCEMGARHVGDIKEICDIVHPQYGVITSIGCQHLETFHTLDNIVSTKYELFDAVKQYSRAGRSADGKGGKSLIPGVENGGLMFINGDSETIRRNMRYPGAITYGLSDDNRYHGKILHVSKSGTVFSVTAPDGETEEFRMKLLGTHNVENMVGAIAVAHTFGISMKKLKLAVSRVEGVPHRLQLIPKGLNTVIDDAYNANPEGTQAALETLSLFDCEKVLVTPGMVELGEKQNEENEKFGRQAARVCDYIILVGEQNTRAIKKGVLAESFPAEKLFTEETLNDAVTRMYSIDSGREKAILLENDLPDNYR